MTSCTSCTGQTRAGNDYNLHAALDQRGWNHLWAKSSDLGKRNGIAVRPQSIQIQQDGNRLRMSFPRAYLPYGKIAWWVNASTLNAQDWKPRSDNYVEKRTLFELRNAAAEPTQ